MALFLLGTKMVRFSISIQPSISPHGFTVAHCTRAVFIKVREVNNDKIKKQKNPAVANRTKCFFRALRLRRCAVFDQAAFRRKLCCTAYLVLLFGVLAGSDSPFFLAALVFLTGFGSATSSARS
jgi:hypothetical protein